MAFALLAFSARAPAHGGFPRAFEIITEPGNPSDVLLRSDVWGFFRTVDGGRTWQWACAEVYGSNSLAVNHQNILILPGGRILVASASKGLRVTDDFCNWKEIADLHGELVEDVVLSSGAVLVLTSTYRIVGDAATGRIDGTLFRSNDNGDHFTKIGGLPGTFAGSALKVSVSDPTRVYVAGRSLAALSGALERSDDGGTTWKASTVAVTNDSMTLRIAAVHPTRPDVVFIWADRQEGLGQDEPDEIWGTADGGQTWTKVYAGAGDLPGFAFSPDGTEMVIAGPRDGIQRAKVNDALASGQAAFAQEFTGSIWGLHWSAGGLTAGMDNFPQVGLPASTYGISLDEGHSFGELMNICEVRYDACHAGSSLVAACNGVYDDPAGGFLQDFLDAPRCSSRGGAGSVAVPGQGGRGSAGAGGNAKSGGSAGPGEDGGVMAAAGGSTNVPTDLHIATGCNVGSENPIRGRAPPTLTALGLLAVAARRNRRRTR